MEKSPCQEDLPPKPLGSLCACQEVVERAFLTLGFFGPQDGPCFAVDPEGRLAAGTGQRKDAGLIFYFGHGANVAQ